MTIEYKGYTIIQSGNDHIMIAKDNRMVMHITATEQKTAEQLKKYVDFYLRMIGRDFELVGDQNEL